MSRTLAAVLCFLLLAGAVVWAQTPAPIPVPANAPWVGTDKYSLHATGTLRDVLNALTKTTGRYFSYNPGPGIPAGEQDRGQAQVTIAVDDTPLEQILLSICQQAGVVYEISQGGGPDGSPINLRPGDMKLDSRPAVAVGDYVIRVTAVGTNVNRQLILRWGEEVPGAPELNRSMYLRLQVAAKSPETGRLLAGTSPTCTATPDQGDPMEIGKNNQPGYYQPFQDYGGERMTRFGQIILPFPPEGATKLTRLDGALVLFSTVKVTEVRLPPHSDGQTFTQDDVSVAVQSWKPEQGSLVINVVAQAPSLPRDNNRYPNYGNDWQTAVMVMKDGREVRAQNSGGYYGGGGEDMKLLYRFPLTQPDRLGVGAAGPAPGGVTNEIDYLRLTFYRGGQADKTVPFVIENVPLP